MTQVAGVRPKRVLLRVLPWVATVGTLLALLMVVLQVSTLFWIGLKPGRGMVIEYVAPGGPANTAGLRVGDRLTSIDGHAVWSRNHFRFLMRSFRAGDTVAMGVERPDGRVETLTVVLAQDQVAAQNALVLFVVGLAFVVVGVLVHTLYPDEQGCCAFLLTCVAVALSYGTAYASNSWLGLLENAAFLVPSLVVQLFVTFPVRRWWISRAWGKGAVLGPGIVLCTVAVLTAVGVLQVDVLYTRRWAPVSVVLGAAAGLGILLYTMAYAQQPVVRQQLKWIAWGIGAAAALNGLSLLFDRIDVLPAPIGLGLANWVVLIVPVAFALSILRYRLFDVDTVINRSIVYVVLVLAVLSLYLLVDQALALLDIGVTATSPVAVALLVVVLTVTLSPFYRVVQGVVDRMMYAGRLDYRQVFRSLSAEIANSLELDHQLEVLLRDLGPVTQADRIDVFLRLLHRDQYDRVAGSGAASQMDKVPVDHALPQLLESRPEVLCMPDASDVSGAGALEAEAKACMHVEGLVLCIPLRADGAVIGWLGFGAKRNGALYPRDERRFLLSVADQTAMELQKALLYREAEDRARQLAIANEISRSLTSTLDLQELLNRLLAALIRAFSVQAASLLLLDPESSDLVFQVAQGLGGEDIVGTRLPSGVRSIATYVVQTGEPYVSNDVHAEPEWYPKIDQVTGVPTRQLVAVPLVQRGRAIGVIEIVNRQDGTLFSEQDVDLLVALAAQVVMVIDNARLHESTDKELAERVRELTTMQEIDRQLNASLDFDRVMDRTLRWAISMTNADAGFVGLVVGEEGELGLWVAAAHGYPRPLEYYRQNVAPLTQGVAGRVATSGHLVRLDDVRQCADYLAERESTQSELAVPVIREQRVSGVINLESDRLGGFGEASEAAVVRLADHAAIAMENARLYQEVNRANESKGEFVSLVSHELKAPMTVIKGYSELLQLTVLDRLDPEEQRLLDTIMSNVEHMQTLINDLLELARLESGTLTLERYPTQLPTILGEVMASFRHSFDERDLFVSWKAPPDLPRLDADPVRLNQILTNLVSNAVKYTPPGGDIEILAEVDLDTAGRDGDDPQRVVCCTVRDSGVGISPADQSVIFQKFFRANHPLVRKQAGTGLGLSITKTLVEMHGGRIWFESEPDQGTAFSFTIPLVTDSAEGGLSGLT